MEISQNDRGMEDLAWIFTDYTRSARNIGPQLQRLYCCQLIADGF